MRPLHFGQFIPSPPLIDLQSKYGGLYRLCANWLIKRLAFFRSQIFHCIPTSFRCQEMLFCLIWCHFPTAALSKAYEARPNIAIILTVATTIYRQGNSDRLGININISHDGIVSGDFSLCQPSSGRYSYRQYCDASDDTSFRRSR